MFSVTKALCPIDFSYASEVALDAAVRVVEQWSAELYLLHVIEGPAISRANPDDSHRAEAAREAVRDRLASIAGGRGENLRPHLLVSDGDPAEEILRMEEIFGIDLVVIAPHSRPTLGKIIFGSVAEKVSRGSRANLLVVKKHLAEDQSAGDDV